MMDDKSKTGASTLRHDLMRSFIEPVTIERHGKLHPGAGRGDEPVKRGLPSVGLPKFADRAQGAFDELTVVTDSSAIQRT